MTATSSTQSVLVLGVGNALMQDDGVGSAVTNHLRSLPDLPDSLTVIDGGTIGLQLLPQLEDADAVIVVDAAEVDAPPGEIRIFRDRQIDRQLSGKRRTVHEVALLDLFSAATLRDRLPSRRALIAIQPGCTDWGDALTSAVNSAVPDACRAILDLSAQWLQEEAA